jgi:hypothetical protein
VNADGKADYCREVGNRPGGSFLSCALATNKSFDPTHPYTVQDLGNPNSIRTFADVNGDGRADYCREIGNNPFLACALATQNCFNTSPVYTIADLGYRDSVRQFVDVNGDGKADYCREVGNRPHNSYLACDLATANGFDSNHPWIVQDIGYDTIRQFADVNGDGKADYCREVGNRPHSFLSCALATQNGFNPTHPYQILDLGYADSIRAFADVNGDGKADYCREVGNRPDSYLACILAGDNGFRLDYECELVNLVHPRDEL